MDTSKLILETQRLYLKPVCNTYREEIFKEFTKEITTYMDVDSSEDIKEIDRFIQISIKEMKWWEGYQAIIVNKNNHEFVWGAGLHHINSPTPSIGIRLKSSIQWNGYGKEVIQVLKNWLDNHIDYHYIIYMADKRNIPSRKLAEFLGGVMYQEKDIKNANGKVLYLLEYRVYKTK